MAVTQERFAQGMTYEEYRAQMTRNHERFEANEQAMTLPAEDIAFFARLPQSLNVVALAEDWCGDVIANLPVLGHLAQASSKLNIRVFLRDQNLDIMDQYLKDGQFRSIPVFVFFDQNFREVGCWIERPARVSELLGQMRRDLFANDPLLSAFAPDTPPAQMSEEARNRYMQANSMFRLKQRGFSNQEVARELRALVEQGIAQAAETKAAVLSAAPTANGAQATRQSQAKVSILYCADCGYEPQTLELTSALMKTFLHDLSVIELIPWQDGAFDVTVNGDLIHSMYRDGGFPEHETIIRAVRERLG